MHHKFITGQVVDIIPAARIAHYPIGPWTIVGALPLDGEMPRYRVQSHTAKMQRVVGERDLRPSVAAVHELPTDQRPVDRITIGRR